MENLEQIIEETVVDEVTDNAIDTVSNQGISFGDVLFIAGIGTLVVLGGIKLYKNVIKPRLDAKKEANEDLEDENVVA